MKWGGMGMSERRKEKSVDMLSFVLLYSVLFGYALF